MGTAFSETMTDFIHPWQRAGLGLAPFHLVSVSKTPGTSCDFCGTGIKIVFVIGGVDGSRFKVGCDCVRKVNARGTEVRVQVEKARKDVVRADRHAKIAAAHKTAREAREARNAIDIAAMHVAHPGLAAALETKHSIVADIRERASMFPLSDAQIALVFKLAREMEERANEVQISTPTGRVTFTGTVVKEEWRDGDWGSSLKLTIKVVTPEGVWMAWGTCPTSMLNGKKLRGATVQIKATLTHGSSPNFAFFKRPNGKILTQPEAES